MDISEDRYRKLRVKFEAETITLKEIKEVARYIASLKMDGLSDKDVRELYEEQLVEGYITNPFSAFDELDEAFAGL